MLQSYLIFIWFFFYLYYFIQFQKLKPVERLPIKTDEIATNDKEAKDVKNIIIENPEQELIEENIEDEIETEATKEINISEEKLNELFNSIEKFFKNKSPYTDPDFNLIKLASQLNTNITYVSRALKNFKNVNFKTYLNSYRINEIKERLNKGEHKKYTLKHLYSSVGFTHQTTFNRVFKEIEGITPSEYIERLG